MARWQDYQTGAAGGASSRAGHGFRGGGSAVSSRHGKSGHRASRLILWGGLAGALVAVLVAIIWNLPHPTPVVVLTISDYVGEFAAPNAYAAEDAERLEGLLTPRGWTFRDYRVHPAVRDRNRPEGIRASLAEAIEEAGESEALVIYLSAHGAVDHEGRAVLLAERFDPDDLAGKDGAGKRDYPHWTAVEDLLRDIRENVPAETRKIVFLDANRAPLYWQLDIGDNRFENAFAAALEAAVSNGEVPNLYVINSAAPGQIGWAAPELGGSVFGYYVARGLAGRADLDRSGEIRLDELLHYIRGNVERWVEKNRLAAQVPAIYGLADNNERRTVPPIKVADASAPDMLEVVSSGEDTQPLDDFVTAQAAKALANINKGRQDLEELWSRHAKLAPYEAAAREDGSSLPAYSRHPAKWARLELLLVRAEQYLFAGRAYREKHFPGAVAEAQRNLAELEDSPDAPPPISLPLAEQGDPTGYAGDVERLEAAAGGPLSRGDLTQLAGGLSSAAGSSPEPVETLFVRMLDAYLAPNIDLPGILPAAIETRLLAERTAAPSDVRALPWARAELTEDREELRRQLEDRLFLGTEDDARLGELHRSYQDLREQYRASAERVGRVIQAYRLRDEALCDLVHLAQWHLTELNIAAISSRSDASAAGRRAAEHREQLQRINEWRTEAELLGQGLVRGADDFSADLPDLGPLRKSIDAIPQQFRGQAGDEEQPRQIWWALQTPLLTGDDRDDARRRFVTMLEGQSQQAPGDAELPPMDSAAGMLADAGKDGQARPTSDWAAILAGFSRQPAEATATSSAEVRDSLEKTDHEDRAIATHVAYRREARETTPKLLKLSRYSQFVWLADRAVDDFWGPPPGAADGEPYFAQAVGALRPHIDRLIKTVVRDLRVRLPDQDAANNLDSRLAARQEASREGIGFTAPPSLRAQKLNPLLVSYPPRGLPEGQAIAWASDEFGLKIAGAEGQRIALRTDAPPSNCELVYSGDPGSQEPKSARLTVLFRGHVWPSKDLHLPTGNFRTVTWAKSDPGPPRVTVQGDEKQVPYVLFILDCSNSMEAKDFGGIERMTAAKDGLQKVVQSLLENAGKFEIGLVLYGRRYGEVGSASQGYKPKDLNGRDVTWQDVLTDVEPKFNRLPLNRDTVARLRDVLKETDHFGITPLYHAIRQGLIGSRVGADQPLQVVVITDGADTQYEYKEYLVKAGKLDPSFATTNEHHVREELRKLGDRVRLDFLGMGFKPDDAAIKALHTLASETGGRFHDVRNTLDLESSIESLLRPAQFSVRHVADSKAAESPIDLEDTWVIRSRNFDGGSAREYVVEMHRVENPPETRVVMEGGEHLLLKYRRESPRASSLSHFRYFGTPALGSVPIVENLANPLARGIEFSPEGVYIAAHKPERERSGAVEFRISVQNQEERNFSLRPRHVWADVRPCLDDRPRDQWPVYPFFDLKFQEGTPVPVLLFTIPEWPWRDTDAEIQIWCSYEQELDVRELPIRISAEAPEHQSLGSASNMPGVTFEADLVKQNDRQQFQVIVSEYHNEQPLDLFSARVQMSPVPDAAKHKYYTDFVRHEFTFDNSTVLGVEEAKILITPRDAIQALQRSVAVDGRTVNDRRLGPLRIRVPNP